MKTPDLNGRHLGSYVTFNTLNGNTVSGGIERVQHLAEGTYLILEGVNGTYQTDRESDIAIA